MSRIVQTSPAPLPLCPGQRAPSWRARPLLRRKSWLITSVWRCSQLMPAPSAGSSSSSISTRPSASRASMAAASASMPSPVSADTSTGRSRLRPALGDVLQAACARPRRAGRSCSRLRSAPRLCAGVRHADRCRARAGSFRRRAIALRHPHARRRAHAGSRRPPPLPRAWRGTPRPAWSAGRR